MVIITRVLLRAESSCSRATAAVAVRRRVGRYGQRAVRLPLGEIPLLQVYGPRALVGHGRIVNKILVNLYTSLSWGDDRLGWLEGGKTDFRTSPKRRDRLKPHAEPDFGRPDIIFSRVPGDTINLKKNA